MESHLEYHSAKNKMDYAVELRLTADQLCNGRLEMTRFLAG